MPANALTTRPPGGGGSDVAALMQNPAIRQQVALALPKHLSPDRLLRIALTCVRQTPKLAQCDQTSLLGAVMQSAQLGLEPGGALGHAYLVPYGREVQFIVGYRGMIDLARRSGQIVSIEAHAVYEGDEFDCQLGLHSDLKHTPDWDNANRADPKMLRFVYAVAKLKDGGIQFHVMSRAEVERIRSRSKASNGGPWVSDYEAMSLKTVVRQLFKFLPVSIELAHAVTLDEAADRGHQENPLAHLSAAPVAAALPESVTVTKALLSEQQLQTIGTAMERRLNPVGVATFTAQMDQPLEEVPADQFSAVMAGLSSGEAVDRWNAGFHSETGDQLLDAAVIESIVAASVQTPDGNPEPAVARRRVGAA